MIAPEKLEAQRLAVVKPGETKCSRCGRRTRDKSGVCSACRHYSAPDLKRLTTDQLAGLVAACRTELTRRRDEIDGALERT